ncbi:MAG: VCBS repeat-containing protein [Deltaproteobacteria bacterium]|nr:VCBS repeat-containing protein [Deltaproteobacteria bacterium]
MSRSNWFLRLAVLSVLPAVLCVPLVADAAWPPADGADMSKPENWPNDGGFAQGGTDADGKFWISGGDWNQWSFVPDGKPGSQEWDQFPGFRQAEKKMGTGMHTDRAWQKTTGDRRVIIAVLDSGIKWDADDLVNKYFLNRKELPAPAEACRGPNFKAEDPWDADGDGIFNTMDYATENGTGVPKTSCDPKVKDANNNGLLDPGDLIAAFSDGKDDDSDGYTDNISGWDFFRNDNNPYDDTRYGHGTGEAHDSSAEGNNGRGGLGMCPNCTVLMVRVADSFVCDGNDFGAAVTFAVDNGASVIQEALGSLNRGIYAEEALSYAYANNVAVIASAADELSFHHNMPGTTEHTIYVHAIVFDGPSPKNSTTFLNFNNCTNWGANLLLSSPGTGCSSEATGVTSGHAGMIYAMALQSGLNPPLSAEEVRGVLIQSSDDIDVPESKSDPTKFPSGPGWDHQFGYGRNNVRASVDMVQAGLIPPEVDIWRPRWFEPIEVTRTPKVKIEARIGNREDGLPPRYASYDYVLEYAKGVDPKSGWVTLKEDKTAGMKGELFLWDVAEAAKSVDFAAPLVDHDQYTFTVRLRVEAKTKDGKTVKNEFRKAFGLYKDPTLLPGFPINTWASVESSPKMFDLNGDGKDEMILPTNDGIVHAWQADGTEIKGWPVQVPLRRELSEDFAGNTAKACAYRTDKAGCKVKNFTMKGGYREFMVSTPAIGDLDGDGKVEVIQTTYDGHVLAWHADGSPVAGFPLSIDRSHIAGCDPEHLWDDGFFAAATLADLDKDGKLEIIVPGMDQYVYVWRHDGKPQPGWPVRVADPEVGSKMGDRIIATASVGDVDGDGSLDIAIGTNEVMGADKAKNEGRGYILYGDGSLHKNGPYFPGFPVATYGVLAYVLPTVGSGVPGAASMADLDYDGKLEVNFDTIGAAGTFFTWEGKTYCPGKKPGKCTATFNNSSFGPKSDSTDSPSYMLIASGALGKIDPTGGIDYFKAAAGFNIALTFASGGKRANFDHQVAGYDTLTGKALEGWPRVIPDWQFFGNAAIVDIDTDNKPEVVVTSAGYMVHAWNYLGEIPKNFPKMTMGWVLAAPAIGDMDGDGKFDLAAGTRDGFVFAWKTDGTIKGAIKEWPNHGHDLHNTFNYQMPINPYAKGEPTKPEPDAGSTDTAPAADVALASDTSATTKPTTAATKADDSGCSSAAHPGSFGWLLALAAAAGLVARRRRLS